DDYGVEIIIEPGPSMISCGDATRSTVTDLCHQYSRSPGLIRKANNPDLTINTRSAIDRADRLRDGRRPLQVRPTDDQVRDGVDLVGVEAFVSIGINSGDDEVISLGIGEARGREGSPGHKRGVRPRVTAAADGTRVHVVAGRVRRASPRQ